MLWHVTADWQVITQLLSSSKCPSVMWGPGSRGWVWHHVARSERGYSCTRLPHISWRLKCWSRQPSPTARGRKRVWLSSLQNMLSMIASGYFRVLSLLTYSSAGSSQSPCPAMDTPSAGALCWPVSTKVSRHSAVSVTPHLLRMLACSHQSCLTHGVAGGLAGRAPCGGTASPEMSTAKILTQLQLQIRTGCSCWNPGALQQQITAGNEKKSQRGRRRREEFPPLLEGSQKSAAMDLAHYFHSAKPASQYADPAPNDLHPELHLACWIPKICSGCVLACQGPSMLGKHLIQFFKKALFCWAVT